MLLGWDDEKIANEVHCHPWTVKQACRNLQLYDSYKKPRYRLLGAPQRVSDADEAALLQWLLEEGWRYQDEII
jgi:hypothetical protein